MARARASRGAFSTSARPTRISPDPPSSIPGCCAAAISRKAPLTVRNSPYSVSIRRRSSPRKPPSPGASSAVLSSARPSSRARASGEGALAPRFERARTWAANSAASFTGALATAAGSPRGWRMASGRGGPAGGRRWPRASRRVPRTTGASSIASRSAAAASASARTSSCAASGAATLPRDELLDGRGRVADVEARAGIDDLVGAAVRVQAAPVDQRHAERAQTGRRAPRLRRRRSSGRARAGRRTPRARHPLRARAPARRASRAAPPRSGPAARRPGPRRPSAACAGSRSRRARAGRASARAGAGGRDQHGGFVRLAFASISPTR